MKSANDSPDHGQKKPEHARPMSCRGSDMQRAIAAAVRKASPDVPAHRQSWRVRGVINGSQPACPTLEAVIDERIAAGASEDDVMAIAHTVTEHTRQKLIAARPAYAAMIRDLDVAILYETQVQGPADVVQVESFRSRCMTTLKALLSRTRAHRDAQDLVIVAAEREIAEREREHTMTRARFNLAPRGRAS